MMRRVVLPRWLALSVIVIMQGEEAVYIIYF